MANLLDPLTPISNNIAFFEDVVRSLHSKRQQSAHERLWSAKQELSRLEVRKQRAVDFFFDGKIDQATYDTQSDRLGKEMDVARKCFDRLSKGK